MPLTLTPPRTATWLLSGQFSDDQPLRTAAIDASPFTVGRRPDQALTIPSPTISSRHAELILDEDRLFVRDLGSTNGTFVNGSRVQEMVAVQNGDLVQFADIVFRAGRNNISTFHATVQDNSADRRCADSVRQAADRTRRGAALPADHHDGRAASGGLRNFGPQPAVRSDRSEVDVPSRRRPEYGSGTEPHFPR